MSHLPKPPSFASTNAITDLLRSERFDCEPDDTGALVFGRDGEQYPAPISVVVLAADNMHHAVLVMGLRSEGRRAAVPVTPP